MAFIEFWYCVFSMAPKKKRKTIDNKSLSRRPVVCGECNKTLERYESLNPRFDIVHHGKAPFEKGQIKLNLGAPIGKRPFRSNEAEDTSNSDTSATASNDPLPLSPPQARSQGWGEASHPQATEIPILPPPPLPPTIFPKRKKREFAIKVHSS